MRAHNTSDLGCQNVVLADFPLSRERLPLFGKRVCIVLISSKNSSLAYENLLESIKNIKEHSIFIIDEFDSLYDPLSSDLNFPFNPK